MGHTIFAINTINTINSLNSLNTLDTLFLRIFNLSISAGWMIAAIIVTRVFLRKTPKWIICLLWVLVGLRLILPIVPESRMSLVPSAETIPETIMLSENPAIESGIPAMDAALNHVIAGAFATNVQDSVNPMQIIVYIASRLWVAGVAVMLFYMILTFLRLNHKMRTATLLRDNIFQSEFIVSPFILGIVKPRIYVPYGLSDEELSSVLAHEHAHLMRRDHLLKPAAFAILSVYWFNPMVWAAYILLCRDVEFACDERVIRSMDSEQRRSYSMTLLNCTEKRRIIAACPLAFGEIGIKQRILRIKDYRKPLVWITITSVIVCVIIVVCFLTNPSDVQEDIAQMPSVADKTEEMVLEAKIFAVQGDEESSESEVYFEESPIFLSPDEAINHAILEHNEGAPELTAESSVKYPSESTVDDTDSMRRISCCSFVTLDMLSATPTSDDVSNTHTVTYYGWALYEKYIVSDNGIEEVSGSHIPVALTFDLNEYGYILKEYWEPGEGSYFTTDIANKFPAQCIDDAIDSQKYIMAQKQSCYEQAVIAMDIDTEKVIEHLLGVICGEPATSSSPQDYIDAHYTEFRELIYYGKYTIDYFNQKYDESSEDTLESQILMRAYREMVDVVVKYDINEEEPPMLIPLT